eukprot:TRINITY_DN4521_c1_g1_i1.p1 TRINITY_DN4521_c1_g1~~TRINITY_DN4521_c1_g1_i1.p1  ORF type:complete len:305 (-),score=83.83 TRINITY_DN4521_c1_g1_i1:42-956(-)
MEVMMKEMCIDHLQMGTVIGQGNFGKVYSGVWNDLQVALKCIDVEGDESGVKWKEEIRLLDRLRHPNVVRLLGLYNTKGTLYMVMEYAENGSAETYLRVKGINGIDLQILIKMAFETARGMNYLAEFGVIHRDLSCRNLLLDSQLHVKLSDFGMSRENTIYRIKTKTLPFRWCAPEVLTRGENTTLSDVWSFGVVIFEIFSYAKRPYDFLTNEEVAETVSRRDGRRLEQPEDCPQEIWEIAEKCFEFEAEDRPTFKSICNMLTASYPELEIQLNSEFNLVELEEHYVDLIQGWRNSKQLINIQE